MFAPAFYPLNNPEAIVNCKLALAFLENGYSLDIITKEIVTEYNYSEMIDDIWEPLKNRTIIIKLPALKGIKKYIEYFLIFCKTGHLIPGSRWAMYAYIKANQLLKERDYDVIISRAMPDCAHLPALLLSKRRSIPWVANWNDPHDEKAPHPWAKIKNFTFLKKRYNNELVRFCNWHTFPSSKLQVYMAKYLGKNVFNSSSVIEHIALAKRLSSPIDNEEFRICYSGALYKGRDPSPFFEVISELRKENPVFNDKIKLFFIGKFDQWLVNMINSFNVQDITVIEEPMAYYQNLEAISKMTILFSLETNYTEGIFCPSKIVDYYQVSRPILALGPSDSEVQRIIENHGGGLYAPYDHKERLRDNIMQFFLAWQKHELYKFSSNSSLESLFSPSSVISKFEKVFLAVKAMY
jgi:hypothetical protein